MAPPRPRSAGHVARRCPAQHALAGHEVRILTVDDEGSVREPSDRRRVTSLPACRGVNTLGVKLSVHRIGTDLRGVHRAPDRREADVVLAPAQGARAVARGERGRLVQEEQLGEAAGLQQGRPMPVAEAKPARDPPRAGGATTDAAVVVVEAPTVPVHEPARWIGDELTEGGDAVLQRHRGVPDPAPAHP